MARVPALFIVKFILGGCFWLYAYNNEQVCKTLKLTITRSKNSVCFYVQCTVRIDGHTTTKTVEKLCNLEMVKTQTGGQDPHVWAKAYVDDLSKKQYNEQSKSRRMP